MEQTELLIRVNSEKLKQDGDGNTLSGYAIRWGSPSNQIYENGRVFTETIQRGAFDGSLNEDIKLYFNHQKSMPLARSQNGSLTLRNDPDGLWFEAKLPDTTLGNDVKTLLREGILTGEMSFGFYETKAEWSPDKKRKEVQAGVLREISVVVDAAYPTTSSVLRHSDNNQSEIEFNLQRIEYLRRRIK